MNTLIRPVRRALDKAQRRFVRSRAGSVLILVVALLVLMALIGTAFMSMAQSDRGSAAVHTNNAEIDLVMSGVVNLLKGTMTADLMSGGRYRPGNMYSYTVGGPTPTTYGYFTGHALDEPTADKTLVPPVTIAHTGNNWIASRLPELLNEDQAPTVTNMPLWRYISAPLSGMWFESPYWPAGTPVTFNQDLPTGSPRAGATAWWVPTTIPLPDGSSQPALQMVTMQTLVAPPLPMTLNVVTSPMLAADADGDGIADSALFKLPMGSVNGITYYAALRVVDNAAAVNVNTAWTFNPLSIAGGFTNPQLPGDFFPSSIDLLGLVNGGDISNNYFNNYYQSYRWFGSQPSPAQGPVAKVAAFDDNGTTRSDFNTNTFTSALEALWTQLGRRIGNPGFTSGKSRFLTYPTSETLGLARNFILHDPDVSNFQYSPSLLEQALPYSTYVNAPTVPYFPGNELTWYQNNFWFYADVTRPVPNNQMFLRSVLTADNPVSNFSPGKLRELGTFTSTSWPPTPAVMPGGSAVFAFGDTLTYTDAITGQKHRYVCINPNLASAIPPGPPTGTTFPAGPVLPPLTWKMDNDAWVYEPWSTAPTKTSVNTATFGQLYAAYASAMADQYVPSGITLANGQPLWQWGPAFPNVWDAGDNVPPYSGPPTGANIPSARMFRSPLRVPPPTTVAPVGGRFGLSPVQVMQLRAALAAVNTIDLRDSDDDVTSRTVHLIDNNTVTQPCQWLHDVVATVYGMERQPFITKVYATNAVPSVPGGGPAPKGYVAIEIFNPDPTTAITLNGWGLATINRPGAPVPAASIAPSPLAITPVPWGADPVWLGANAPVIPPLGSIIVASFDSPPSGVGLPPNLVVATPGFTLTAGQIPMYILHNLDQAMDQELVLVRPRLVSGLSQNVALASAPKTQSDVTPPQVFTPQVAAQTATVTPYFEGTVAGTTSTLYPAEMVPVDSYDFSGLAALPPGSPGPFTEWYYARPGANNTAGNPQAWHFVYPGHYAFAQNPLNPTGTPPLLAGTSTPPPRLIDGTVHMDGIGNALLQATKGAAAGTGGIAAVIPFGNTLPVIMPFPVTLTGAPLYRDIPLQLNTIDCAGPNGGRPNSTLNAFPYGGFARNGDILQVPFIGSYRLTIPNPVPNPLKPYILLELNPVTMDSAMALAMSQPIWGEEPDISTAPVNPVSGADPIAAGVTGVPGGLTTIENVGRFCPISSTDDPGLTITVGGSAFPVDDFAPPLLTAPNVPSPGWLYHWTTRVFDYVTVQSPQQDYLPDVDPAPSDYTLGAPADPYKYFKATGAAYPPDPSPVANVNATVANAELTNAGTPSPNEETAAVQGLVNINTAPWRVLMTVPWVPPSTSQRSLVQADIAMSIVYYRDVNDGSQLTVGLAHGHGPFRSIYELANVPIYGFVTTGPPFSAVPFRDLLSGSGGGATLPTTTYNAEQGNLSGAYLATSNPQAPKGDFQSKYMMINRVSNLITTRSDSFIAYVVVQGWRDAETNHPTLAVQRRATFLIDRTGVTPTNPLPSATKSPRSD